MSAERVELTIERLAAGGDGVGRDASGRVVFVPFTAPGDRIQATIEERRARFARGRLERLLASGPSRVEPRCPAFGDCGGCTWQHVAYETQREAKEAILRDALERLGGLALPGPVAIEPCPAPYGYRGRTRVLAKGGRVGYRRRRSHALCAVRRCPVLVPALEAALAALADERPAATAEWELVAGAEGVRATPLVQPLPRDPRVELEVAGERIAASPGVFVQATPALFASLAEAVHTAAGRGALGLELFAGAGFFSVGLARRFTRLVVVESEGRAVADLRHNLARSGCPDVEILGGRAERVLCASRLGATPDAAVLDPPRTGLPRGALESLLALAPKRLVYVSCEPSTLARDLSGFCRGGYRVASVRGFDLFPQTPHVEAVAVLSLG